MRRRGPSILTYEAYDQKYPSTTEALDLRSTDQLLTENVTIPVALSQVFLPNLALAANDGSFGVICNLICGRIPEYRFAINSTDDCIVFDTSQLARTLILKRFFLRIGKSPSIKSAFSYSMTAEEVNNAVATARYLFQRLRYVREGVFGDILEFW